MKKNSIIQRKLRIINLLLVEVLNVNCTLFLREGEVDRLLDDVDFGERFEGYRDRLKIGRAHV